MILAHLFEHKNIEHLRCGSLKTIWNFIDNFSRYKLSNTLTCKMLRLCSFCVVDSIATSALYDSLQDYHSQMILYNLLR